jgi:hypothetical protein
MDSKIFYVGSNDQYRVSGTESDFVYQLDVDTTRYNKVVVLQASIPVSYYLVETGDLFYISENGSADTPVSITPGNYNVNSFIAVLTTALNAASPNGWTYSMSIPNSSTAAQTGKFTYNISGSGITSAYLKMTTSVIYQQLGFDVNTTNNFTVASATSASLVSQNCVNFVPITSLYILSDIIQGDHTNDWGILQDIYGSNAAPFSNIVYICSDYRAFAKNLTRGAGNSFRFTITDANSGATINTNGLPVYLSIMIYREEDIFDLLKQWFRYMVLENENQKVKEIPEKNKPKEKE